jgi:hypothetical protein
MTGCETSSETLGAEIIQTLITVRDNDLESEKIRSTAESGLKLVYRVRKQRGFQENEEVEKYMQKLLQ